MSIYDNLVEEKYKKYFQQNGVASFSVGEVDDPEQWVKTEQSRFDHLNNNGMPMDPPTLMFFKGEQPRTSDRVI